MSPKPIEGPTLVRYLPSVVIGLVLAVARQGICAVAAAAVTAQAGPTARHELAAPQQIGPVRASPTTGTQQRRSTEDRQWYGYQLMLTDLGSIAVGAAYAGVFDGSPLVGAIPLLLAPTVVHKLHGRLDLAAASPLARVGFTVVGAFVGWVVGSGKQPLSGLSGLAIGGGIGLATAMIVDYSCAVAPRREASGPSSDHPPTKPHAALGGISAAGLVLAPGGASVVLGGTF